jgi:alginate O-acetyltransferase complex protein AlgI
MVFSSPIFIFLFLPIVLIGAFASWRGRNLFLFLASLFFYTWGEGPLVGLMVFTIVVNYATGLVISEGSWRPGQAIPALEIGGGRSRGQKLALVVSLVANLGLLGFFKYFNFGLGNFNALMEALGWSGAQWQPAFEVTLPLGISFFTFQSMSYSMDVYLGNTHATRNLINFGCYVTMFPQLVAGPIVRYKTIAEELVQRTLSVSRFATGIRRFVIGLAKKLLIANAVALPTDQIFSIPAENLTPAIAWLGILGYTIQIYFDFSGYSDMAIGLGHMFGFTFPENFNYPYIAQSITEFWRRWHMSLSTWFRDYLYIPLGGSRKGAMRTYFNLWLVFFLCGLWHGASWSFAVWGMFHGVFLVIERLFLSDVLKRMWRPLRHGYTMVVVMMGWALFRGDTLPEGFAFIKAMFGIAQGDGIIYYPAFYLNNKVLFFGIIGMVAALPVLPFILRQLDRLEERLQGGELLLHCARHVAALVLITGLMIYATIVVSSETYNPFIYFRF